MALDRTAPFPMDYEVWVKVWAEWQYEQEAMKSNLLRTAYCFPDEKNFMADSVLGIWRCSGQNVELSDVTFLNTRGVGVTYGDGSGTHAGSVCHTFKELEEELHIYS